MRTQAQAWLRAGDAAEGPGLRVGDLEFHPGIAAMGGYDSNPFYRDDLDVVGNSTGVVDSAVLRLTPHLDISTLSKQRRADGDEEVQRPFLDFRAGLSSSIYYLSAQDRAIDRVEFNFDVRESLNPGRPFSVHLVQEASNRRIPLQGGSNSQTHLGAGIRPELATPGGLFRGSLRYKFGYDFFDDSSNNYLTHQAGERMSWEFLPKTAIFQDLELTATSFRSDKNLAFSDKNDSIRISGRAGLNGALTKTIALTIAAGLTDAFVDGSNDSKDFVGQVQLRWRPTETLNFTATGRQTGENALQGNTLTRTGGELEASLLLAKTWFLHANAKLDWVTYGDDVTQIAIKEMSGLPILASQESIEGDAFSTDPREDLRFNLDLGAEYRVVSWLAFTLEGSYYLNSTDYVFVTPVSDPDDLGSQVLLANPAAYEGYRILGGARVFL